MSGAVIRRFAVEWKLKAGLGGILATGFWAGYFLLEHRSGNRAVVMPASAWDDALPLIPEAAWMYVSQFLTTPLILWLAPGRRAVLACCAGVSLMAIICFSVYFLMPTAVERPEATHGRNPAYEWVLQLDQPFNACPSLHAGFGVFLAGCAWTFSQGARARTWLLGAVCLWTLAVLAATMLIKQHVLADLAAGGLVGLGSYWSVRHGLDDEPRAINAVAGGPRAMTHGAKEEELS